jgi:hypothetical protein
MTAYAVAAEYVAGTAVRPAQRDELLEELVRARLAAVNAAFEVNLIAPADVADLSERTMRVLVSAEKGKQAGDVAAALLDLRMAMRRDLGEH